MNSIQKDIFKAIHEGKWLSTEYKNRSGEITKYWIGIRDIDLKKRTLLVSGLYLSQYTLRELTVYIDSILSSATFSRRTDFSVIPDTTKGRFSCADDL